ncbi:capreomycidine synthase [Paractinoplanes rishiriensis]|nr:capreomycidine synthase [Actinoplanes rishiriensis]
MGPARLEDWLRDRYFTATYDLSSSGVEPWSYGELRDRLGLDPARLDRIRFTDNPSLGNGCLREALAARFAGGDPDRVMTTHGSSEAAFLVFNELLSAGDRVVVVEPAYHALRDVPEAIGCEVVPWRLPAERDFAADLAELDRLVAPGTRMVIVNLPHNPTGATITAAQQRELVDVVRGAGAYLLWDAAFAELTYGGPALPDPALTYRRCISLGTLSKAYGLPGLRVGWCVADPDLLPRLLPLRDRMTLALSPLVEFVATAAVRRAGVLLADRLRQAAENRESLLAWAATAPGVAPLAPPAAGVTAFPRLLVDDVDAFCTGLLAAEGVLLAPGSCFGHPDRVRLGYGGNRRDFELGLERTSAMLAKVAR